jgi:hypothetical protein
VRFVHQIVPDKAPRAVTGSHATPKIGKGANIHGRTRSADDLPFASAVIMGIEQGDGPGFFEHAKDRIET